MAGLTDAQKRDAALMTAQGETPERIAAHFGADVAAIKRPARKTAN